MREVEVIADPSKLAALGMSYSDVGQEISHSLSVDAVGRVTQSYSQYLVVADQAIRIGRARRRHRHRARAARARRGERRDRHLGSRERDRRRRASGGADQRDAADRRQYGGDRRQHRAASRRALQKTLPPGVRLVPVYDQASLVRDALASVRDAMLIGALLAVLVLFVFLRNARVTAIAASSIPLTLAITVGVMSRLGQTFNLMTLGAMAIAIGLVVDDAIVITENIVRHMRLTRGSRRGRARGNAGAHLARNDIDAHHGGRLRARSRCSQVWSDNSSPRCRSR